MAADITRTARDDATDALTALEEAAHEVERWRAHLRRVVTEPTIPAALQARRSASIVAALVGEAHARTRAAVCGAEMPDDALTA